MSEQERIIKVKFDPLASELRDIFADEQACALWCLYRDSHIISGDALDYLNSKCRDLIWNKKIFNHDSAREFLNDFMERIRNISYTRFTDLDNQWIESAIPFLVGDKKLKLVRVLP